VANPFFFIMTGLPGAGKTHFASRFSEKFPAVWINSDSLRVAVFENPRDPSHKSKEGYKVVFGGLDYFAAQALRVGYNVIYDANNNQEVVRVNHAKLAEKHGATPVIIHIRTDAELAKQRAGSREESVFAKQITPDKYGQYLDSFEAIGGHGLVIELQGTDDFETQYKSFAKQLEAR
jgi:predicted kinase